MTKITATISGHELSTFASILYIWGSYTGADNTQFEIDSPTHHAWLEKTHEFLIREIESAKSKDYNDAEDLMHIFRTWYKASTLDGMRSSKTLDAYFKEDQS